MRNSTIMALGQVMAGPLYQLLYVMSYRYRLTVLYNYPLISLFVPLYRCTNNNREIQLFQEAT